MAANGILGGRGSNQNSFNTPGTTVPDLTIIWPPLYGQLQPKTPDTAPAVAPTFVVDWSNSASFPGQLSVSRTSSATYYDSFGHVVSAAAGGPRIDNDPLTGLPKGLLIEEQRTNLVLQSGNISSASWSLSSSSVSGSITAPDGVSSMFQLKENALAGFHYVWQDISKAASNIQYTMSCYAKIVGSRRLSFSMQEPTGSNGVNVSFDLINGQIGVPTFTSGSGWSISGAAASITPIGNGIYHCTLTGTSGTETTAEFAFILDNGTGTGAWSNNYTGNGASGAYIWGVNVEAAPYASSYIPTTTAAATRSADIVSSTDSGLLAAQAWAIETGELRASTAATILGVNTVTALGVTAGNAITTADGGTQTTSNTGTWTGLNRAGIAWDSTPRVSIVLDGGTVATAANTPVTPTTLYFGNTNSGASGFLNGHIRSIAAYSSLSDTNLGTVSAVGSSFDIYGAAGSADGAASGAATVTAVGASTVAEPGSSTGLATVTAVGASTNAAAGSSTGSATVTATGAATKTAAGAASGTGTATGTGAETAAATGTVTGSGTATAGGAETAAATGSSTGAGSASAVGASAEAATGSAAGTGTASGIGAETAAAVGSAAGSGAATAIGAAKEAATGSSTGSATVTGGGNTLASGSGTGAAQGVATATSIGASVAAATGAAAGSATVSGTGTGIAASIGSAVGSATVAAAGAETAAGTGTATGSSVAAGVAGAVGPVIVSATGLAVGSSTATATSTAGGIVHVGMWHVVNPALSTVPQGAYDDGFSDGFEVDTAQKSWQVATAKPAFQTLWHVTNPALAVAPRGAYSDGFDDGFDIGGIAKVWEVANAKPKFATQGSFSKDFSADFEVGTAQKWRIVAGSKPIPAGAYDDGFSDGFETDAVTDKIWKKAA